MTVEGGRKESRLFSQFLLSATTVGGDRCDVLAQGKAGRSNRTAGSNNIDIGNGRSGGRKQDSHRESGNAGWHFYRWYFW
jgi:hypothetical protein